MSTSTLTPALARYEEATPTSRALFERSKRVVTGGVSRLTLAFEPYPFYAAAANGARITDVDGNTYLDLVNNYTSLPHGHAHGPTTEAVLKELQVSSAIGTAYALEAEFAEELQRRLPVLEQLHFTTTGSEAVGFAVRVARANTVRSRVLKFEGGFHGSHNELYQEIAVMPPLAPGTAAPSRPASEGLEPTQTLSAVYNDPASVRHAFEQWGHEIAAVVIEPFLGNGALITASRAFLDQVFVSAREAGSLVIFDEIQSLRADYSGAHGLWGYTPDLLCVGKIVGGGYALAAFGGRAELFHVLDGDAPRVLQTGTFTAAPIALAAGRAALEHLTRLDYADLDRRTAALREGFARVLTEAGIPSHINGLGSMFNISISAEPVDNYRAFRASDAATFGKLRLEMLTRGVLVMPRGTGCLSTAVTDEDVDMILDVFRASVQAVSS